MYRGEYYATQSDAHVSYTQNWDSDIIEQFEQTHNEMAVLSTYLTDVQGSIDAQGHSLRNTRPIMCNTRYEGGVQGMHLRHGSQPERPPAIHGIAQLQPWWAGMLIHIASYAHMLNMNTITHTSSFFLILQLDILFPEDILLSTCHTTGIA